MHPYGTGTAAPQMAPPVQHFAAPPQMAPPFQQYSAPAAPSAGTMRPIVARVVPAVAAALGAMAVLTLPWYQSTYVPTVGGTRLPELGNAASKSISSTAWQSGWMGRGAVAFFACAALLALAAAMAPRGLRLRLKACVAAGATFGTGLALVGLSTIPTLSLPVETFSGDPAHTGVTLDYSTAVASGLWVAVVLGGVMVVSAIVGLIAERRQTVA